jgi:hypothetical protein
MGGKGKVTMFEKIINPSLSVYDGETNKFIGEARFDLLPETENKILQMVNYHKIPHSVILMNLDFVEASGDYVPPVIGKALKQEGIIRAVFIDTANFDQLPIEIRFKYNAKARGYRKNNPYLFDSFELSNIELESIQPIIY